MCVDPYSLILFKGSGSVAVAPAGCFIVLLCVMVLGVLSSLAIILQRRFT